MIDPIKIILEYIGIIFSKSKFVFEKNFFEEKHNKIIKQIGSKYSWKITSIKQNIIKLIKKYKIISIDFKKITRIETSVIKEVSNNKIFEIWSLIKNILNIFGKIPLPFSVQLYLLNNSK